jgi:lysyl endopeptidase
MQFRSLALAIGLAVVAVPGFAEDVSMSPMAIGGLQSVSLRAAGDRNDQFVIDTGDASYVKVNFDLLDLPPGAQVLVSNPDGTEVYRYGAGSTDDYTVDAELGQDGKYSFSAMSISGPVAIVRVVSPASDRGAEGKHAGMRISSYYAGYPDPAVPELDKRGLLQPGAGKSICGVDDKRDAVCFGSTTTAYQRSRPVARLLIGGRSLCTGWRVGSGDKMFTNNHCFTTSTQAAGTEVWFNYQRTTCGGTTNTVPTKVSGRTVLRTNTTYDYTLFTINNASTVSSFGFLSLDVRAPRVGEGIFIAQHPGGKPKQIATTSDRDGGSCKVNGLSTTDAAYYCDTEGGSSGSPVFATSSGKVVALHHLGGCTNQGARIDKIWPGVSTYFGGVVP